QKVSQNYTKLTGGEERYVELSQFFTAYTLNFSSNFNDLYKEITNFVHPGGKKGKTPVLLDVVGYSTGAAVAMHFAQKLVTEGYKVRLLFVIDPVETIVKEVPRRLSDQIQQVVVAYAGKKMTRADMKGIVNFAGDVLEWTSKIHRWANLGLTPVPPFDYEKH